MSPLIRNASGTTQVATLVDLVKGVRARALPRASHSGGLRLFQHRAHEGKDRRPWAVRAPLRTEDMMMQLKFHRLDTGR